MQKAVWYSTGILALLSWTMIGYAIFTPDAIDNAYTLFYIVGLSLLLTMLFIMQDPECPKNTVSTGYMLIGTVAFTLVVLLMLTSVKKETTKNPKQWNRIVNRIKIN